MVGRKGGGKGGGGDFRTPHEEANSIASAATGSIIDLLCEGPIGGLIDPGGDGDPDLRILKSVFFDNTPVMAGDGSFNFEGITLAQRTGEFNQALIPGFEDIENEVLVGLEVTDSTPVTQRINDTSIDAIRVKVRLPSLVEQITQQPNLGDLVETSVTYKFELSVDDGAFTNVAELNGGNYTQEGKAMSPFDISHRFELPTAVDHWDIRMSRVTPDSAESTLQNRTFFSSLTEIIDIKITYTDSAIIGLEIDARQFGTRVPRRTYRIQGRKVLIPDNYDPVAHTYDPSVWTGEFKTAVTSNPVWILFDIITNDRFGLGQYVEIGQVDKFAFYDVGVYCDELVDDGVGGQEPRYRFNGLINTRENAYAILQAIASSFHGMLYWSAGLVSLGADMPTTAARTVIPENTKGGEFVYGSAGNTNKPTVVEVIFQDPNNQMRAATEWVEKTNEIPDHGVVRKEIFAVGCSSRGQAHRYGRWYLDTEWVGGETISYQCGLDQAGMAPAEVIQVGDPDIAGVEYGGRITGFGVDGPFETVNIDREITDDLAGGTLHVVLPDGVIASSIIQKSVAKPGTGITQLSVGPYPTDPLVGAIWGVATASVQLREFRVLAIKEDEKNEYTVNGIEHDPGKFDRIEKDLLIDPPDVDDLLTGPILTPTNLAVEEFLYKEGSATRSKAILSWTPPEDPRITFYETREMHRTGARAIWRPLDASIGGDGITQGVTMEHLNTLPTNYTFQVRAFDNFGRHSVWSTSLITTLNAITVPPSDVENFETALQIETLTLRWDSVTDLHLKWYEIRYSPLTVGATWAGAMVHTNQIPPEATSISTGAIPGTYFIKAVSIVDVSSVNATFVILQQFNDVGINFVETIQEDPTFPGVHNGTEVIDGTLRLTSSDTMANWIPLAAVDPLSAGVNGFTSPGIYDLDGIVDLGSRFDARITSSVIATGLNTNNTMAKWATLAEITNMAGFVEEEIGVEILVSMTDDDPGGSPTWTPYRALIGTDLRARAFRFRAVLTTTRPFVTPVVSTLAVTVDMFDRVIVGENISSGTGGLFVDFVPDFKSVRPSVQVTGQNLVDQDYMVVSGVDETGFTVEFFNGVVSIDRTFDYHAQGYGVIIP